MSQQVFVHALYDDEKSAEKAVEALVDAHFDSAEISVLMKGDGELEEVPVVKEHTGGRRGALIGGVLGAAVGAVGLSGFVAAGPVLAALSGLATGGLAGTFGGTIVGLGYWKTEAEFPEDHFAKGGVMVGVSTAEGRVDDAWTALEKAGGHQIASGSQTPRDQAEQELG